MESGGPINLTLLFDADFDLFLSPDRRGQRSVEIVSAHATTIKDIVESCGVPHTEIGELRLNGSSSAGFKTRISDGDCIEVLPVKPAGEGGCCSLQPVPPESAGFVTDIHLGKAARRLRLLGFDTCLFTGQEDSELLDIMQRDGRILLTRDRRLLMNNRVIFGCCIRSDRVNEQVRQVVGRYSLAARARPFSRCLACNGFLESCLKSEVEKSLLPKTRLFYDAFFHCSSCGRIYWEGAHIKRLRTFVNDMLG
jgi:uncharacterized protein with PIN domain